MTTSNLTGGLRRAIATAIPRLSPASKRFVQLAGAGAIGYGLQKRFGAADNFFDHRFVTSKDPGDLAGFYGGLDCMAVFFLYPFFLDRFMMRGGTFDDDGVYHTLGLTGGQLEVSIEFNEREEETDGDGEPDTIAWFNKRERFKSTLHGRLLWEMTQNFGYNRKDDGTCEVYHHGERFDGLLPIRVLLQLHAMYVFWATKRYIESIDFGEGEVVRQKLALHVFKELLANLYAQVEKSRESDNSKLPPEHDKTLAALRRLYHRAGREVTPPHFNNIRLRGTAGYDVQLVVDDGDSEETIRAAMKHIGVETIDGLQLGPTLREQDQNAKPK
jgi:hypothetical protein